MSENKRTINFNLKNYRTGNYSPETISGEKVVILSTNYNDEDYKIVGYIGESTQLESWTLKGKYYSGESKKERNQNVKNLLLVEKYGK